MFLLHFSRFKTFLFFGHSKIKVRSCVLCVNTGTPLMARHVVICLVLDKLRKNIEIKYVVFYTFTYLVQSSEIQPFYLPERSGEFLVSLQKKYFIYASDSFTILGL